MDEVTPEPLYRRRREFLKDALRFTATAGAVGGGLVTLLGGPRGDSEPAAAATTSPGEGALAIARRGEYAVADAQTPLRDVTTYNNFYEFGLDKGDPAANAHTLRPRPWTVTVDGDVARPATFSIDDLLAAVPLEERVYRMRCV